MLTNSLTRQFKQLLPPFMIMIMIKVKVKVKFSLSKPQKRITN